MAVTESHPDTRECTLFLHRDDFSPADVLCSPQSFANSALIQIAVGGSQSFVGIPSPDTRRTGNEVSIHERIARVFGFRNQSTVTVSMVEDFQLVAATHVELSFRDQFISRDDIWRLTTSQLHARTVYQGQKVTFMSTVEATVESIYVGGHEVLSAYYSLDTKPIFRSQSSRYIICVQVSAELYQWSQSSGELGYETILDAFLPDLFRRWEKLKVRHLVTLILFARVQSSIAVDPEEHSHRTQNGYANICNTTSRPQDFYEVVSSDAVCTEWLLLVRQLRQHLRCFVCDIVAHALDSALSLGVAPSPTLAANGNILEAIHLTSSYSSSNGIDQDLTKTGTSLIVVTAGSGLFNANLDLLRLTTDGIIGNGIGIDIVSIAPKPLHAVPVFKYETSEHSGATKHWLYALPHWANISFYERDIHTSDFSPCWSMHRPCGMTSEISLPRLQRDGTGPDPQEADKTHVFLRKSVQLNSVSKADLALGQEEPAKEQNSSLISKLPGSSTGTHQWKPPSVRHISLGAPGLGRSKAEASTSLSIGEPPLTNVGVAANSRSSSILTQQIRTLSRKPSQQNVSSPETPARAPSKPVDIEFKVVAPNPKITETTMEKSSPHSSVNSLGSMSPWLTLQNPSNPRRDNMVISSQYRIWQHIYAKPVLPDEFKWQSMSAPAKLPLTTEYLPTNEEIKRQYYANSYTVSIPMTTGFAGDLDTKNAVKEMVGFRLSLGYQIVAFSEKKDGEGDEEDLAAIGSKRLSEQGEVSETDNIMMVLGDSLHHLTTSALDSVEVTLYTHRSSPMTTAAQSLKRNISYEACIRNPMTSNFMVQAMVLRSTRTANDWQVIDKAVTRGRDERLEQPGLSKSRYVLIPVNPPQGVFSAQAVPKPLSDEERRLEGIQKLTQMWQRGRYISAEDRQHQASIQRPKDVGRTPQKDANPLAIEYQTRDPSAVAMAYGTMSDSVTGREYASQLFIESEMYHSSEFDTGKLMQHLQEAPPKGVQVKDRRWYTKMHMKCFRGDEMTNWLLRHFKDVFTREEAVVLGKDLMARGLFTHVRHRHDFRDGNYFYQIVSDYRTTEYPDTTGLFRRGGFGRSVPSTPVVVAVDSPPLAALLSRSRAGRTSQSSDHDNPRPRVEKPKFELTRVIRYDLDPSRMSQHAEILDIHYDRIHSPENCYHIHLEWTNATSRLIEENLFRWANMLEPHGLKIVQLPVFEASSMSETNLLQVPHRVSLALQPPDGLSVPELDERRFYHKALLRNHAFILDHESAESFAAARVDVIYSWAKPSYRWHQYIHKSGLVLVQIDDRGDFLLTPNNLAANRRAAETSHKFDRHIDNETKGLGTPRTSPMPISVVEKVLGPQETVTSIVHDFEELCKNETALRAFYESLQQQSGDAIPPIDLNG